MNFIYSIFDRNSFLPFYSFLKIYLFIIYFFTESSLLLVGFLSWACLLLRQDGATLCCSAWVSYCSGFSYCGARALGMQTSIIVVHGISSCSWQALEYWLSSCGRGTQLLHGIWDLPVPGIVLVSPHWQMDSWPLEPQGSPFNIYLGK